MRAGRATQRDNVVRDGGGSIGRRTAAVAGSVAALALAAFAPAAGAASHHHDPGHGGDRAGTPAVTLDRSGGRITLANGYVRAGFDLAHPGIDVLQGDFAGGGEYGADVTASGADPLNRSGVQLQRTDVLPARVLDQVGITDRAHGNAGQVAGPAPFSLPAEQLPPAGQVAPAPADTHDDVPVRMPDTSGAAPNVALATGQTFTFAAADRAPAQALHVFAFASDGDATGTFTLHFADGSTETHAVTVPDWGAGPTDRGDLHPAFAVPYRHRGTSDEAHTFIVYDAVIPVSSTQPLTAVTFPDGVPNRSTSQYATQLQVVALTAQGDRAITPDLGANDPPPGAGEHASSQAAGPRERVTVLRDTADEASVRIRGVVDDAADALATSTWTLTLTRGSRALQLDVRARALRDADVGGLRLAGAFAPQATYGQFARGVTERINSSDTYFASDSRLHRFYALGGGAAVDVRARGQRETVLRNAPQGAATPANPASGVEQVLVGTYPRRDDWDGQGWGAAQPAQVQAGERWHVRQRLAPNDHDFPSAGVPAHPALPPEDLEAVLTGVYATAAGVLDTYALPGEAAPTLATPGWSYGSGRNFYDPDTFLIDSALLWSGDRYLVRQARQTIERSESEMAPSGQIPHHFDGDQPTFVAISGATQTGPNIFWIQAALRYAAASGDEGWLRGHMPAIEQALGFLTDRFDPAVGLIDAPGPLWIDVFIRNGYTSDTNAYMVGLLRDVAEAEEATGHDADAARHRAMSAQIAQAMNDRLWAGDHYVTQLNHDGSTRDLVDYDSNLLAVANGVATGDRAAKVLARVDGGQCTHARATWVSEKYYGPNDTYGGNTGDSAVTMGRIGWADAYARVAVRDANTFQETLLAPLQRDLLANTWLTERYDCAGHATRAPYYHEYPELVVMLLREVAYGIRVGLTDVTIDPLSRRDFTWSFGGTEVRHSARQVVLRLPGTGTRRFAISALTPGAVYQVHGHGKPQRVVADAGGTIRFAAALEPRGLRIDRKGGAAAHGR